MSFKVGDLAILTPTHTANKNQWLYGQECEIVSERLPCGCGDCGEPAYKVSVPIFPSNNPLGDWWWVHEEDLSKRPPKAVTTWDECKKVAGWKPKGVAA